MYIVQTSILCLPATKDTDLTAPRRYAVLHVRISKSIKSNLWGWKTVHPARPTVMQQDSYYNYINQALTWHRIPPMEIHLKTINY